MSTDTSSDNTKSLYNFKKLDNEGHNYSTWAMSGHVQDQEHAGHPGACGALTDLQRVTQGECIPAE